MFRGKGIDPGDHAQHRRIDEMKDDDRDHGRNEVHRIDGAKLSRRLAFFDHPRHLAEQRHEILPGDALQLRRFTAGGAHHLSL